MRALNSCCSGRAIGTLQTIALFGLGLSGLSSAVAAERWYTTEQIEQGRAVFQEHCASCHGGEAQGLVEDWQTADENGRYPPPPLNGSAHTWHHALPVLRRTIRKGNVELGGQMPAFAEKIGESDTDAAIAYFQSFWSDEVYATWLKNSGPVKVTEKKVEETAGGRDTAAVTARLAARLPRGAQLGSPEQTPIGGVYRVKAGNAYVYLSGDGRYALIGDMLDLTTGENLTERRRAGDRLGLLEGFADTDKVIFMAQGEERAALDVFTDTSCPYCRKLHAEVPQLRNAGVTVRYLPFPRGGTRGSGYADLKAVWCAADRAAAMDIAKGTAQGRLGDGDCNAAGAVNRGYLLGQQVGITGTPAILLPDGRLQAGYLPAKQLIELLGLGGARQAFPGQEGRR